MDQPRTPIYLARNQRDADMLNMQLAKAGIFGRTATVATEDGYACQVSVPAADARRGAEMAGQFEAERYGENGPAASQGDGSASRVVPPPAKYPHNPVGVFSARSPQEAYLMKNALEREGIQAVVADALVAGGAGVDLLGMPTAPKVLVAEEDSQRAHRLVASMENIATGEEATDAEPPAGVAEPPVEPPWPRCPQCDARRTTRCPVCHTSGTDFPAADAEYSGWVAEGLPEEAAASGCGGSGCGSGGCSAPGEEASEAVSEPPRFESRLVCSTCDEPFVPEYPRVCEWCGHEFADGYEAKAVVALEEIPARAIAVIVGLGVLALGLFVYFLFVV